MRKQTWLLAVLRSGPTRSRTTRPSRRRRTGRPRPRRLELRARRGREHETTAMGATFGIEEEFTLLDAASLDPVDLGARAVADLGGGAGTVTPEFFASQIEHASPVLTTYSEALEDLIAFRRRLAEWAQEAAVIPSASGTPFRIRSDAVLAPDPRYARIADQLAGLTRAHQINGLHVHVGIAGRDEGVESPMVCGHGCHCCLLSRRTRRSGAAGIRASKAGERCTASE